MIVFISAIIEMCTILYGLFYLNNKKMILDFKSIGLIMLYATSMFLVYTFFVSNAYTLLFYPIVIIYMGFEFGFHWRKNIINFFVCIFLIILAQAVGVGVASIFTDNLGNNCSVYLIIDIGVFLFVKYISSRIKEIKSMILHLHKFEWVSGIIILVSVILIISLLFIEKVNGRDVVEFSVFIVAIIIMLIIITALYLKYKEIVIQQETDMKVQKLYLQPYQQLVDDIRSKQHEFDNHLNTIYSQHYLYDNYEDLVAAQKKYMKEIEEENYFNKVLLKDSPLITGFLYSKFLSYKQEGIQVHYKITFSENNIDLPILKLIELIGNLLNNAVDSLKEQNLSELYVVMKEQDNCVYVEIRNEGALIPQQTIGNFFKKGYSSKGKGRGQGLYNVKKICNQNHIEIVCHNKTLDEKNWIAFELLIPCSEKNEQVL